MKKQLAELERIAELVSADIAAAAKTFERFKRRHAKEANKHVIAKMELLEITFAVSAGSYKPNNAHEEKLIAFFESKNNKDDAVKLLLKLSRHYFVNGEVPLGEQVLERISRDYYDKVSVPIAVSYLVLLAYSQGMKAEDEKQLDTSFLAMEKLRQLPKDTWYFNNLCFFNNCIIVVYCRSGELDKAKKQLDDVQAIADTLSLSKQRQEQVNYGWTWYYTSKGVRSESMAWFDKQINFLRDEPFLEKSLFEAYMFASTVRHELYMETPPTKKAIREQLTREQEQYLIEAVALHNKLGHMNAYELIWPCLAQLEFQKGNHAKAVTYLNKGLKCFTEQNQKTNELNCYREMHKVYLDWGTKTKDHNKLLKAYKYLKKDNDLMLEQATHAKQQKLEAIKNKYELRNKELNEKILHQQVEAMSKEIQLTAIHLQEKTMVLDELKVFVKSLQKKEMETRLLINTIARKIDSVKITEQDKSYLQQKIDNNNQHLSRQLAEKHPELSNLEIQICSLLQTGMTNKELSKLYGRTARSYEQHRYRIKKKIGLTATQDLVKHLIALNKL